MKFILMLCVFFISAGYACTDFLVFAKDGAWVGGRSLEFGADVQSMLKVFSRKQQMISQNPDKTGGLQWTSKYGYIGVTALGVDLIFEGLNEMGLSFSYLWLPGYTQYPSVAKNEMKKALDFTDFGAWTLGQFSTIAEVKAGLKGVRIWGHEVPSLGIPPVHAAIHDSQGNSIVVEFVGGELKIYDNPMSVLTNSPPFDWQITNLQNYVNLDATNANSYTFRGKTVEFQGQGSGLLGLPGDWTPPSRFVKTVTSLRFAHPAENAAEAVNLCEHLLNSLDIILGEVREKEQTMGDYTQWIVIRDTKNKVFYFRTYRELTLKMVDLKKLDFNKGSNQKVSLEMGQGYRDVTASFK